MTEENIPHPPVVARETWLEERKKLLTQEKEWTRRRDRINAERRRLPMVKIEKEYVFDTPEGKRNLRDLFEGRRQLIVYHFMFGPDWEQGCPGCTGYVDALGVLSTLNERDTTFTLVSRAPLTKLDAYKASKGWRVAWVSSFESDFNYDFHVTLDATVAPVEYNYKSGDELAGGNTNGEAPGISVFFRMGEEIFHTYSTYARGGEGTTDAISLLDLTPYGRQEDFEESPAGWPQKPTYG